MKKLAVSSVFLFAVGLFATVFTGMLHISASPLDTTNTNSTKISETKIVSSIIETALASLSGTNVANQTIINTSLNESSAQWGLSYLSVESIWDFTFGNPSVIVAVLDTGIDVGHPDLAGQVIKEINFSGSPTVSDILGHGTHIAGIIAANLDNHGIVGIAPQCKLFNVKVAEDDGSCEINNVALGIVWAVDNGAQIINISIQLDTTSPELDAAVEYAKAQGAIIVAAAGNNLFNQISYPAYYSSTIAVTALTPEETLAPLANIASWVDFAVPGYKIYSTLPGGDYGYKTGTSFATAHVSGIIALLYSLALSNDTISVTNLEIIGLLDLFTEDHSYHGFSTKIINLGLINNLK